MKVSELIKELEKVENKNDKIILHNLNSFYNIKELNTDDKWYLTIIF